MTRLFVRGVVGLALISVLLLAAVLFVSSRDGGSQAVEFGLEPTGAGVTSHPIPGTKIGQNLCSAGIATLDGTQANPDFTYLADSGTATGGSASTLVDSGGLFQTDGVAPGNGITIIAGPGFGQTRTILTVDSETQVTVTPDWTSPPASGSAYRIADCNDNATNGPLLSPAYVTELSIPAPASNFESLITFGPPNSTITPGPGFPGGSGIPAFDAEIHNPSGSVMGIVSSNPTRLALSLNSSGANASPCQNNLTVEFAMLNGTVDFSTIVIGTVTSAVAGGTPTITVSDATGALLGHGINVTSATGAAQGRYIVDIASNVLTVDRDWDDGIAPISTATYEITNQIYPRTPGISNHLGPLAQEDPGNPGLPLHATRFPSYLLGLFDPDLVHPLLVDDGDGVHPEVNGGTPPLQPLARYTGRALVAGDDIILEFMIFAPDQLKQFSALDNHPWANFVDLWGYPSVVVLIDPTVPASPSQIQDFCAALGSTTVLGGTALENIFAPTISGTVDTVVVASTELTDTLFTGAPGLIGNGIRMTSGAASGETREITDHVGTTITVANFDNAPSDTDSYEIFECGIATDPADDIFISCLNTPATDGSVAQCNRSGSPGDCNPRLTNPDLVINDAASGIAGTDTNLAVYYVRSFRDYDDDGIENQLDSCASNVDTWSDSPAGIGGPRVSDPDIGDPVNGDNIWDDDGDGLNNSCDTVTPTSHSTKVENEEGDNFGNRQDNSPLDTNNKQFESESIPNETGEPDFPLDGGPRTDGMGDLSDPSPNTGSGHYHIEVTLLPYCTSNNVMADDPDGDGWCTTTETKFGSDGNDFNSTPEHIYLDILYGLVRPESGARPFVDAAINSAILGADISGSGRPTLNPENFPHPEGTNEPVSGVPMPCSNGFDDDGDGAADRGEPGDAINNDCLLADLTTDLKDNVNYGLNNLVGLAGDPDGDGVATWIEMVRGTDPESRCPADGFGPNEVLGAYHLDINDDGKVNIVDVGQMAASWRDDQDANTFIYRADLNFDGKVNVVDVGQMASLWRTDFFNPASSPTSPWNC